MAPVSTVDRFKGGRLRQKRSETDHYPSREGGLFLLVNRCDDGDNQRQQRYN